MRQFFIIFFVAVTMTVNALPPADLPRIEIPKVTSSEAVDDEEDVYYLLVTQAEEAIKQGDYENAALRLLEAMSNDPENVGNILLLSNLGMIYAYNGQDTLAIQTLNRAHEIAPKMVTILNNRGQVLLNCGRDKEAFGDFEEVISLDSLNVTARYYHGLMSFYSGDLSVSQADLDVLLSQAPNSYEAHVLGAVLFSNTGRNVEAIRHYRWLVDNDPSPEFYAGLAGCYLLTDRTSDASELLSKGLSRYPEDAELLYYRAWLCRDLYRLDEARDYAQRAIKAGANPQRVKALFEKRN